MESNTCLASSAVVRCDVLILGRVVHVYIDVQLIDFELQPAWSFEGMRNRQDV